MIAIRAMDRAGAQHVDPDPWDVVAVRLSIAGMECPACADHLEERVVAAIDALPGPLGHPYRAQALISIGVSVDQCAGGLGVPFPKFA
jgi:hypothetical protein